MMEQLYNDFTTKLLPTIQQGLIITKDYFLDLFARYIKYLIITDSVKLLFFTIAAIVCWSAYIHYLKMEEDFKGYYEVMTPKYWKMTAFLIISIGLTFVVMFKIDNLIQDIFVPEFRIYEQLKGCEACKIN